jgi:IS5 family transposase
MTRRKQPQQTLWEGMVAEDVKSLWEPWMIEADKLLDDEELIDCVYEAQGQRHENSRTRGRSQTPAEMALRLLLLKHVRNWSYDTLEREVRANLAYRDFCRIRIRQGTGCQDVGTYWTGNHWRGDLGSTSATRRTRA